MGMTDWVRAPARIGRRVLDGARGAWRGLKIGATYGGSSTLERPSEWLRDAMSLMPGAAGQVVTPETALTLPVYFAIIHLIARTVASLPRAVYKPLERGREKQLRHPIARLLNDPNPYMTGMGFWEAIVGHAVSTGNGFAWIDRDMTGRPAALWPVHPSRMRVDWMEGQLRYFWQMDVNRDGRADLVALRPDDVLHIHGFGPDGLCGYSLIQVAAEAIGLGLAQQSYSAGMFGNDTQLGTIIRHPGTMSEASKKAMRQSWTEMMRNKFTFAILDQGVEVTRSGIPPKDAQMIEAGMFNVIQICRFAGVPPHKVAALERATFSNIEHQNIEWTQDGVVPWVLRVEQECDRKLYVAPRGTFYTHLNVDGLLRGDYKSRVEGYRTEIQIGTMTIDEAREKEERNPLPDGLGEEPLVQGAMMPLRRALEEPEPAPAPAPPMSPEPEPEEEPDDGPDARARFASDVERLRPVFEDAASRVCRREAKAVQGAMKRRGEDRKEFAAWAAEWHRKERAHIMDAFRAPIDATIRTANDHGLTVRAVLDPVLDQWERDALARTLEITDARSVVEQVPRLASGMAATVFEFVVNGPQEQTDES